MLRMTSSTRLQSKQANSQFRSISQLTAARNTWDNTQAFGKVSEAQSML